MPIILSTQLAFAAALIAAASLLPLIEANGTEMGIKIGSRGVGEQEEFDYFNFALYWAPTYCNGSTSTYCCSSNACCRGSNSPTTFTIHGLWPNYDGGKWPSCCTEQAFDENEISTLGDAMDKYWPALSCSRPSSCNGTRGSFWSAEWEKHGTCTSPVFKDEYSYFSAALNLYFKYNVTEILNEAGYVPSNTEKYAVKGIVSAIQNAFGATPRVFCQRKALVQLYLCFYKDFKPRDCVDESSASSSCPKKILIPASASLGYGSGEPEILQVTDG